MAKKEIRVLPNPDAYREQCVEKCMGCSKMFSDENIGDVCEVYESPKTKWEHLGCAFNYKPEIVINGKKVNPLKASKKKSRR